MDLNELFRDWMKQHGNKKNADVRRFISIMNAFLSNDTVKDTVKQAVYLGAGVVTLKVVLDSINKLYKTKCESDLDKLMMSSSTMIVDNIDDIEDWTNIEEEE